MSLPALSETDTMQNLDVANIKRTLRAIRDECVSGSSEMHEVDAQWIRLFGYSGDAPWKP